MKTVNNAFQSWVRKKVRNTASIYNVLENGNVNKNLGLEDDVVDGIVGDCLGVTGDSYVDLPTETKTLERSLLCNMIMWDSAEVPAAPEPPVIDGVSNWDPSMGEKATPLANFFKTPVACARAAGVLAGVPQVHAPNKYSITSCWSVTGVQTEPWSFCSNPDVYNCICFEKCWEAGLRRICDLAQGCCSDYSKFS